MLDKSDGVVLADLSHAMLQEAITKGDFLRICSHTEGFPFPDSSFSRIMIVDAFHHVCDQSLTAMELWRVLEPGGIIVIEEPDLRKFGVKLIAIAEKILLMQSHFLTPSEISAQFSFPNAEIRIETEEEGFNAWVIIKKQPEQN
jgi:demethylmenaquinone methyltransferase/2-methoxy-6-polyprenyl-1,4-benzoquinol methylase